MVPIVYILRHRQYRTPAIMRNRKADPQAEFLLWERVLPRLISISRRSDFLISSLS